MILASCNRPNIVLYLSSILAKIYLHATICNQDLFLQSEQEILVNDGIHIFFYDQTLNRQSNTICTHENWAPKMLARSESDTKNTFLYVDSNIVLWGKSRNSFFLPKLENTTGNFQLHDLLFSKAACYFWGKSPLFFESDFTFWLSSQDS